MHEVLLDQQHLGVLCQVVGVSCYVGSIVIRLQQRTVLPASLYSIVFSYDGISIRSLVP